MTRVERSALVPFAAPRMYGLVVDVPTYAQRFAWCEQATLLESSDTVQVARLGVKVGGMRTAFTTRNTLVAGERIDMALEEGPFQRLRSEEHTSELQSLMRISYAVFCLKK